MSKVRAKTGGGSNALGEYNCHDITEICEYVIKTFFSQLAQKADQSSRGSVPTSVVARAMLRSSLKKEGEGGILEHKDIVTLGKE